MIRAGSPPQDQIRAAFFDLDGTLLLPDHLSVSPRVARAVHAAHAAGLTLVIATGRSRALMPTAIRALPFDYYITANGADTACATTGASVARALLSAKDAALAYALLQPFGFFIEWFIDGNIAIAAADRDRLDSIAMPDWHRTFFQAGRMAVLEDTDAYLAGGAPGLEKLNIVRCDSMAMRARAIHALEATGRFAVSSSLGRNMEINRAGVTKGTAIEHLCARLAIAPGSAMAFGDGYNDLDMLGCVGYGVAMGGAPDAVKAAAATTTGFNADDGVAAVLERWLAAR